MNAAAEKPIRIGIAACLLGQGVRFDGGHKRDSFLVDVLGQFVEFVPVCPEVELGLGIPRETIRLERRGDGVHLVAPKSGRDHTSAMTALARSVCDRLEGLDLAGYVLKKDSPSCGYERVRVYDRNGVPSKSGRGVFAEVLRARFPHLPVEEEGRLNDPKLRENFIERVFAWRRLRDFFASPWKIGDLVRFHTAEKLLLLAHSPEVYRELGAFVAGAKKLARSEVAARYQERFMSALEKTATRRRHVNVLQHMAGYLKRLATVEERREVAQLIDDYGRGHVPLVVPITLIRHFVHRFGIDYLEGQRYLAPSPKELMLRNHV